MKMCTSSSLQANGPWWKPLALQPPVHRLAGEPVLAVRDVPELARVRRAEVRSLGRLGREEPLALDLRTTRSERFDAMGHHVVGVQADQQVREEAEVEDLTPLPLVEAADRHAAGLARERHRLREVLELHVPPDPEPVVGEVLTRVDRGHVAQRRMDRGAVVALVVVLGDRLPVRRDLVRVGLRRRRDARSPTARSARRGCRRAPVNEEAAPSAFTKTQPRHSAMRAATSGYWDLSNPSRSPNRGAAPSEPSSW